MFGIYFLEQKTVYSPETGIEPVNVLRTAIGEQVGAVGQGRELRYHALRFQNGRRDILIQENPIEANSEEFFLGKMQAAQQDGNKQNDRLVLIIDSGLASSGWIVDASDFKPEQRRDARLTLAKMLSGKGCGYE